jgi:hypothetical protein
MSKNVTESYPIAPQNWSSVLEDYTASAPYNYAVLDSFLQPEVCKQLHQELLNHVGWQCQKHSEQSVLSNMNPDIETIFHIADALKVQCPSLLANYELVEHWAL